MRLRSPIVLARSERRGAERRVRGLTAAATLIDLSDNDEAQRAAALHQKRPLPWQKKAWSLSDQVEMVRSGRRWAGDVQSHMRLFPAVLDADNPNAPPVPAIQAQRSGTVSPADVAKAQQVMDRLRSDDDDLPELQRVAGGNLFVAGEVWLVGTDEQAQYASRANPTGERWRAFSSEELYCDRSGRWGIRPYMGAPDSEVEWLEPRTTQLIRAYRRHDRWRQLPDSGMVAGNLLCEELLLATRAFMATLRSRIPAGILPVPNNMEGLRPKPGDEGYDDDDEDSEGPVLRELKRHLLAPIEDPAAATSLVPYLLEVPPDVIEHLVKGIIKIGRDIDPEQLKRMEHLVRRLAVALDMPPEEARGDKADSSHWNIYELDDDGVRNYVEPTTRLYVSGLVTKMFRPRLDLWGVADPERWTISWDPTEVMASPDRSENAMRGYTADPPVVGGLAAAAALGFSEDEMPEPDELEVIAEWRSKQQPDMGEEQQQSGPREAPGMPPEPGQEERRGEPEAEPLAASAAPGPVRLGARWALIEQRLSRELLVAADEALATMLSRAQTTLRNAAMRQGRGPDAEAKAQLRQLARSLPRERLAPALGPDAVAELGVTDEAFAGDHVTRLERRFLAATSRARAEAQSELRRAGVTIPEEQRDEYDRQAAEHAAQGLALLTTLLLGAASQLLHAPPGPVTVPTQGEYDLQLTLRPQIVRDALTEAGGGALDGARAGGILGGQDFSGFLDVLDGVQRTGFVWETGAPDHPFEPHQELGGLEFDSWVDDRLAADASEFPYVSVYAPGDHEGCQCVGVPTAEATLSDSEPPEEA